PRSGGICPRTQGGTKQQAQHAAVSSTPLRSARNDGVVGSAGAPADLRLMTYDLRLKTGCNKELPVRKLTGGFF
ncbi:MAG: hypothetical protein LBF81_04965, partial [Prevotellaceae bacterium]|nr:hypothetical protein [Prevotellaceae bacterium]